MAVRRGGAGHGRRRGALAPADTAFARGRKRHAKTDRTDCRHLRTLLAGRLPECWIPPARILECRALLETYHDLRGERTAWAQRIHAVLFHQGAPALGEGALRSGRGLRRAAGGRGRLPVPCRAAAGRHCPGDDRRPGDPAARAAAPAAGRRPAPGRRRVLSERLYGVGPVTALAMTCWPGKAGSPPPARRFGSPGWTSPSTPPTARGRQGGCPGRDRPVLRWALYEAGKTHARASAPDHRYYAQVKDRCNGKRAALSEARKILRQGCHILAELGNDALAAA